MGAAGGDRQAVFSEVLGAEALGKLAASLASLDEFSLKLVPQVGSNQFVEACRSGKRVVCFLSRAAVSR